MATHLDLEEQEQLDQLKAFWERWGNLITWVLILVFGAAAAWNGWNWYQRSQSEQAGGMYDELDRAVQQAQVDKAQQVAADLQSRYGKTLYAWQGSLLLARLQFEKGQADAALKSLNWVVEHAGEPPYQALARLRAASLLMEQKKWDEALALLKGAPEVAEFKALLEDRKGDIYLRQNQADEARRAYRAAWDAMAPELEYRHLIRAKLVALGASPDAPTQP